MKFKKETESDSLPYKKCVLTKYGDINPDVSQNGLFSEQTLKAFVWNNF